MKIAGIDIKVSNGMKTLHIFLEKPFFGHILYTCCCDLWILISKLKDFFLSVWCCDLKKVTAQPPMLSEYAAFKFRVYTCMWFHAAPFLLRGFYFFSVILLNRCQIIETYFKCIQRKKPPKRIKSRMNWSGNDNTHFTSQNIYYCAFMDLLQRMHVCDMLRKANKHWKNWWNEQKISFCVQ